MSNDIINKFKDLKNIDTENELEYAKLEISQEKLDELYTHYKTILFNCGFREVNNNPYMNLQHIIHVLDIQNLTEEEIQEKSNILIHKILFLRLAMGKRLKLNEKDEAYQAANSPKIIDIIKMLEYVYYSTRTLLSLFRVSKTYSSYYDSSLNNEKYYRDRFRNQEVFKNSPYQNLILYILDCLYNDNIRRYNGECVKSINTRDGNFTYSWKNHMEISKYIYSKTLKEYNHEQWHNLTSIGSISKVVEYLTECQDVQFREIQKDRNVFSFNNGVYFNKIYDKETDMYSDLFVPYSNDKEIKLRMNDKSAAKYFNTTFIEQKEERWEDIETPNFQKIIDYQIEDNKESAEIARWLYILIGRLFYEVGELDGWQIIPFLKGLAGTGKGTIIKAIKNFFELEDQGILSNKGEAQFGLSAFYDKFIFMAPEIKGDFSLDQATFQSMVSGEDVSVSIKFKTAKCFRWTVPGILAGNEVPNYSDNGGSLQRRLVIFGFMKKVSSKNSDPLLDRKIKEEVPVLIQKCVKAYLNEINCSKNKNIWNVLPNYFILEKLKVASHGNKMYDYLSSNRIELNKNTYTTVTDFRTSYVAFVKTHCKEFSIRKFGPDVFEEPFSQYREYYDTPIKYYSTSEYKYKITKTYDDGSIEEEILNKPFVLGFKVNDPDEFFSRKPVDLKIETI